MYIINKLMRFFCFFLISASLLSCNETNKQNPLLIKGTWISKNSNINSYPSLSFSDSTAVFTSVGDTVYRFKYHINESDSEIVLTDIFNKKRNARILKVNADSLVFSSLWDLAMVQRFYRK